MSPDRSQEARWPKKRKTMDSLFAVVVTHNRKELLHRCLVAITNQTRRSTDILVINNASTDGTLQMLRARGWLQHSNLKVLTLDENTGGAGGFAKGIKEAVDSGADWIWMMDDDAEPHPTALEELMYVAKDPKHVYGSVAVSGAETSWLTTLLDPQLGEVDRVSEIPPRGKVQSLPFLGFLVHRTLVERIGLPDSEYFIAADDVEYCLRAQASGSDILIAGRSRIEHPKSRPYKVKVLGRTLTCLALPPWKRYYDTRNRLLIARKHYGAKLYTQTIPGSFVRFVAALLKEPRKAAQAWAFFAGFVDGIIGLKGKRHEKWGIRI